MTPPLAPSGVACTFQLGSGREPFEGATSVRRAFGHLGVFIVWNIGISLFLLLEDVSIGLPIALGLSALFLWGYMLRPPAGPSPARRWATLRLRPIRGPALTWSLIAIPVLLLLTWALGDVYARLVAIPPESLDPFRTMTRTAEGRLAITLFAVAIAPVVEEFIFRGLIQRELERKRGPVAGICISAALFAGVHLLPWVFPLHFFLGVAFGFAVYATGSIWTGVLLHAANNSVAMVGTAMNPEEQDVGTIWDVGVTVDLWVSVGLLAVSVVLAAWTARKLLESGRQSFAAIS
jgi:membrane protease YdiL (CAAX protease family)